MQENSTDYSIIKTMTKYYYDLHIHSCLSPCADNDMTPYNIAGMAALNGLNLLALTDHNSCGNCKTFFDACKMYGIVPIPGMEITTAEDVHVVALFPSLEDALNFDTELKPYKSTIENKPEIFGDQLYIGLEDAQLGTEENLLIVASGLDLESAVELVRKHNGAAFPAHVDRESNGIIAILGDIPPEPDFTYAEFNNNDSIPAYKEKYELLKNLPVLCSSDAHHLWDINEASNYIEIDDEPYSSDKVRRELIKILNGQNK